MKGINLILKRPMQLILGFILLFGLGFHGCQERKAHKGGIHLESNFDRGSLGPVRIIGDSLIKGQTMHWIKRDMLGNQFYWFYFKLTGVEGKEMAFEFDNMQGTYRGKYHRTMHGILKPVVSYDQETWDRIIDTHFDAETKTFYFRHQFTEDEAWVAYAHPYPLSRGEALIDELGEKGVEIEVIGHSHEGREIHMLTYPSGAKPTDNKKVLLFFAMQHSGEDCGGFFTEGMIQALMAEDENAKQLLDKYVFKIVPMVNPDGLFHGVCRYNSNMEDLNSEWDDELSDTANLPVEPEVLAIMKWAKGWIEAGGTIDFATDVHSHSQRAGDCAIIFSNEKLHILAENINDYWPIRPNFRRRSRGGGGSSGYFTDEIGTQAVTMELSQSHTADGNFLSIPDYQLHGAKYLNAIDEYLKGEEESRP